MESCSVEARGWMCEPQCAPACTKYALDRPAVRLRISRQRIPRAMRPAAWPAKHTLPLPAGSAGPDSVTHCMSFKGVTLAPEVAMCMQLNQLRPDSRAASREQADSVDACSFCA